MRKSTYEINGKEVTGYRIGEYLAIRDKMAEYKPEAKRTRKIEEEKGRWILEHLPTGKILCRGYYREDLVKVVHWTGLPDDVATLCLNSTDESQVVADIKNHLPKFYDRVMLQREYMSERTENQ